MIDKILFLLRHQILLILRQFQKAKELCLMRIKKNSSEKLAHLLLGRIYIKTGEYEQAVAQYKILLDMDHSDVMNYYNLLQALFRTEKYEEVIQIGTACLKEKFYDRRGGTYRNLQASIYWYIAQAAVKISKFDIAVWAFESFMKLNKRDEKHIYESLGYCYERLEKYEEAIANYNKALAIDPHLAVSKHNLKQLQRYYISQNP